MRKTLPIIAVISGGLILLKSMPQILSGNFNVGNSGTGQLIGVGVGVVFIVVGLYSFPSK